MCSKSAIKCSLTNEKKINRCAWLRSEFEYVECDSLRQKKTDESDAQKVIRKALNSAGQGGEDGEAMFFVDLERVYQLLIYLSAAAVASTATSTATLPRLDLLTKFIKLWAKMQATHSCLDNVARANIASLIKIKTT